MSHEETVCSHVHEVTAHFWVNGAAFFYELMDPDLLG